MRGPTSAAMIRSLAAACALCALVALAWTGTARADERVYWANTGNNTIAYAAVDGNGGGQLNTTGATISKPVGVVLDPAGGRIYWANSGGSTIGWANLDGTGGGTLNTAGTTVNQPSALTVNPDTGTLYWINKGASNVIAYALEDGSGGGNIAVPVTTSVDGEETGMTFDPVKQHFYWANPQSGSHGSLGYETLGEGVSGAGALSVGTVATLNYPFAIAYNNGDGSAYWTNDNGKIGEVRTDIPGLGSQDLVTTGATTTNQSNVGLNLTGIAIDERHFRVYWGGSRMGGPNEISYAHLSPESGGDDVDTSGATVSTPGGVALLDVPGPGLAPTITGTAVSGSRLTCQQGSWQSDDTAAFYWRSPSTFTYSWTLNGVPIDDRTSSTLKPTQAGLYTCAITGVNAAGSASSTSKPVQVTAAKPGGDGGGGGGSGGGGGTNPPALALGRVHQAHRAWATHRHRAKPGAAKPPPYGTTFTTTVNRAATLSYAFAALRPGRLVKHRCTKPSARHRHARGCTRAVRLGRLIRRPTSAGTVTLTFRGRLDDTTLAPGRYRLTITATAPSNPRRTRRISFTVVGPPGKP